MCTYISFKVPILFVQQLYLIHFIIDIWLNCNLLTQKSQCIALQWVTKIACLQLMNDIHCFKSSLISDKFLLFWWLTIKMSLSAKNELFKFINVITKLGYDLVFTKNFTSIEKLKYKSLLDRSSLSKAVVTKTRVPGNCPSCSLTYDRYK